MRKEEKTLYTVLGYIALNIDDSVKRVYAFPVNTVNFDDRPIKRIAEITTYCYDDFCNVCDGLKECGARQSLDLSDFDERQRDYIADGVTVTVKYIFE